MGKKDTVETIKRYLDYLINNNFKLQKAYLFGSHAKGTANEESDIDLALILKDLQNSYLMQIDLMKISRKFDTRIEPHPFDEKDFNASHPFASEILRNGIPVKIN